MERRYTASSGCKSRPGEAYVPALQGCKTSRTSLCPNDVLRGTGDSMLWRAKVLATTGELFAGRHKSFCVAGTQNQSQPWADPEHVRRRPFRIENSFEEAIFVEKPAIGIHGIPDHDAGVADANQMSEHGVRVVEGRPLTHLVDKTILRKLHSGWSDEVAANDRTFAIHSARER